VSDLTWNLAIPEVTEVGPLRLLLVFPSGHCHLACGVPVDAEWEEAIEDLGAGEVAHHVRLRG
jgi:hypothetical protein